MCVTAADKLRAATSGLHVFCSSIAATHLHRHTACACGMAFFTMRNWWLALLWWSWTFQTNLMSCCSQCRNPAVCASGHALVVYCRRDSWAEEGMPAVSLPRCTQMHARV